MKEIAISIFFYVVVGSMFLAVIIALAKYGAIPYLRDVFSDPPGEQFPDEIRIEIVEKQHFTMKKVLISHYRKWYYVVPTSSLQFYLISLAFGDGPPYLRLPKKWSISTIDNLHITASRMCVNGKFSYVIPAKEFPAEWLSQFMKSDNLLSDDIAHKSVALT